MNPTLQRAVTSFYNLVYEAQTFATTMSRIDTGEQEHYAGRIEGLNWVLDRVFADGIQHLPYALINPPSRVSMTGLFALFFNCPRLTASFNLAIKAASAKLTFCFVSGQQRMARRSLSILTGRLVSVCSGMTPLRMSQTDIVGVE